MRSLPLAESAGSGFWLGLALALTGCGTQESARGAPAGPEPSNAGAPSTGVDQPGTDVDATPAEIDVVQITTLTTVQASSGLFLSASPRQDIPDYVERGEPATPVEPTDGLDRAEVDLALLFRAASGAALPEVRAQLRASGAGEWSPIEHYFPAVQAVTAGANWLIELQRDAGAAPSDVSREWSGWQAYGGLGVRGPDDADGTSTATAAVATLDFEVRGMPSPLILTGDVGDLIVTNRSGATIERALLIYSHPGGVGVTAVNALGPGASAVTALGPKEHPPERLLELARGDLRQFFTAALGDELAAAIAEAKSIPFLETQGLRLISLLEESEAPATLQFSSPPATRRHVVISHSEILKPDEEARALGVVADESLDAVEVASELGRFSEAKLEFAETNGDDALRARATALLDELRNR